MVVTDGGDTVSQANYQEALRQAQEAEAIVYSIIIVPIEASAGRDLGGGTRSFSCRTTPAESIFTRLRCRLIARSARSAMSCARNICWRIILRIACRIRTSAGFKWPFAELRGRLR